MSSPSTLLISLSAMQPSTFPVFPEPFAESVGTLRAAREAALRSLTSAINQGVSLDGKREKSVPGVFAALKRVAPGCWSSSERLRHPPPFLLPSSGRDPSGGRAGEQRGKSPAAAGSRHRPSSQPWALPLLPRDSASQSEAVADGPTDVLRFAG